MYRNRVGVLLADGLGITGSLDDLNEFCLALISEGGRLRVSRPLMPRLFISQLAGPAPLERMEIVQLLRQLVWLRDLGLACGVADLTRPWREVASETVHQL
jgi:hypothetical protein